MNVATKLATGSKGAKRVILYAGAHKTGSTTLRYYFDQHFDELRGGGVYFAKRALRENQVDPLHNYFRALWHSPDEDTAVASARVRLAEIFSKPGVHTLLIVNPTLLGNPFHPPSEALYPSADRIVHGLSRIFSDYDVELIYFVRDFSGFVPSFYCQEIRKGGSISFKHYTRQISWEGLSWVPTVNLLRDAFGAEKVHVYDYEDLSRDYCGTIQNVFSPFLPAGLLPVERPTTRNTGFGGLVLDYYRLINWLAKTLAPARYERAVRKTVALYFIEPLNRVIGSRKPRLSDAHKGLAHALFEGDRAKLGLASKAKKAG